MAVTVNGELNNGESNNNASKPLGKLIVFEGGEGAGKTTQLSRMKAWLLDSGILNQLQAAGCITDVLMTREPGGTSVGQQIRQLLLQSEPGSLTDRTELLLYAADRAQHVEEILRPAIAEGQLILCDRYTGSTITYQGYGRGFDLSLIHQLNQIATAGLASDLTLWLDIDVELGLARTRQRGAADRMEQSDYAFHQRVRQGFQTLADAQPAQICRIDASQAADDVTQAIQTVLLQHLCQWYPLLLKP